MPNVEVNGATVLVLKVMKGLVAEEAKVAQAFDEFWPEAVGLSISKEELQALKDKTLYDQYELSVLEHFYSLYMRSFGEVRLPTPAYVKALDIGAEREIPVLPLDMNDKEFTERYCKLIGARAMVREAFYTRNVHRKKFNITSPEAFAADWDRRLNKAKGFRTLERAREEHMASSLLSLSKKHRRILAIVEFERSAGVEALLKRSMSTAPPGKKGA